MELVIVNGNRENVETRWMKEVYVDSCNVLVFIDCRSYRTIYLQTHRSLVQLNLTHTARSTDLYAVLNSGVPSHRVEILRRKHIVRLLTSNWPYSRSDSICNVADINARAASGRDLGVYLIIDVPAN